MESLKVLGDTRSIEEKVVLEENPIQRQARLEALSAAIKDQYSLLDHLSTTNLVSPGSPLPSPLSTRSDFQASVKFLVAHLVMEWLDRPAILALASTCRAWQKRCKAYVSLRKRTNLVRDFVKKERTYVRDLNLALSTYGRSIERHGLADKTVIFLNMPVMKAASSLLSRDLMQRLDQWTPSQIVGDVFVRLGPSFDLSLFYSSGLDSSLKLLKALKARPEAESLLTELAIRLGRDLTDFLALPLKRPGEVKEFLKQCLGCTPSDHPDVPHLQRAVELLQSIVDEIGKLSRVESALESVANLPQKIKSLGWSVLREGSVTTEDGSEMRLFLCAGCLVLAKLNPLDRSLVFETSFEFKPSPPVVLSSSKNVTGFDLQTSKGSTTLFVKTSEERISWMQSIKTSIDAFLRKSSVMNVFSAQRDALGHGISAPPSRALSMTLSRKTGMMLQSPPPLPPAPASTTSRKTLTLGRGGVKATKMARGLQKRLPVVDLAPDTDLYQIMGTNLLHLDVHPASLSNDGAFVLVNANVIFVFCAPKLESDSEFFSNALAFGSRLSSGSRKLHIIDAAAPEEQFWSCFGSKYKVADPTPKEVVERYSKRPPLHVIHPDKRMEEEAASKIDQLLQQPDLSIVFDALDDVFLWVGAEVPFVNRALAEAKAEEIFESDNALRPACAEIRIVDGRNPENFIFDIHVGLITKGFIAAEPSVRAQPSRQVRSLEASSEDRAPLSPKRPAVLDQQPVVPSPQKQLNAVLDMLAEAPVVEATETAISFSSDEDVEVFLDDMPPPPDLQEDVSSIPQQVEEVAAKAWLRSTEQGSEAIE